MNTLKKPFKKSLVGKILVGVGDAFTGGTVSNLVYTDENKPVGEIDWKRAGASISTLILILAFVSGKVSLSDLKDLLLLIGGN